MLARQSQDDELRRLAQFKQGSPQVGTPLGPQLVDFFKQSVSKRQTKFVKLAGAWVALVPPLLAEHCALDSYVRGTLTVLVDWHKQKIPIAQWRTTIGSWRSEVSSGKVYYKYKSSDVGPRVWKQIVASPVVERARWLVADD